MSVPSNGAVNLSVEDVWGEALGDPELLNENDARARFNQIVSECHATPAATLIEYRWIENGAVVLRLSNR